MNKTSQHICRWKRRQERRDSAELRKIIRNKLSNKEQIIILKSRSGNSMKEIERLSI